MQITNNRSTEEPAGAFNFSTSLFPPYGAETPGRELRMNSRSKVTGKQSARSERHIRHVYVKLTLM